MTDGVPDAGTFEAVRSHIDRLWPGRRHEEFVWSRGPIQATLPRFRVRRIAPGSISDPWVYVTVGAWEATADGLHGTEFVLLSPAENPLHVELLAMVANLHADARYRLSVGGTINIGRPWMDGSASDHLLVSVPYPFGPSLELCVIGRRNIRFVWLVPITSDEAALARHQGPEALERLLEGNRVDVVATERASLV